MIQVSDIKEFINTYIKEVIIVMGALIVLVSFCVVWFVTSDKEEVTVPTVDYVQEFSSEQNSTMERWFIDIKGAVMNEGVYEVTSDMRVKDVIALAGGFAENADKKQVNLAQVVHDEMVIVIPILGELQDITTEDTVINLNTATKEKLMTVKGIGEKKADAIVAYRQKQRIKKLEDLLELKGFSEKFIESIRPLVRIS